MSTFVNAYDSLEKIIFENGLRIQGLHFYPELDMMLLVLNNKKILKRSIASTSGLLAKANSKELNNYEFMGDGAAIHWPDLDEDLSLKGFLQDELAQIDMPVVA